MAKETKLSARDGGRVPPGQPETGEDLDLRSRQVWQILDRCRDSGLRSTKLLNLTIELFVNTGKFLSAKQIAESEKIADSFDQASVYRLVRRLEQSAIVRRIGLPERAASYALRQPHRCDDYIICTVCGAFEKMEMDCPVGSIEGVIASASGYTNLEHELKFFGTCPDCSAPKD